MATGVSGLMIPANVDRRSIVLTTRDDKPWISRRIGHTANLDGYLKSHCSGLNEEIVRPVVFFHQALPVGLPGPVNQEGQQGFLKKYRVTFALDK